MYYFRKSADDSQSDEEQIVLIPHIESNSNKPPIKFNKFMAPSEPSIDERGKEKREMIQPFSILCSSKAPVVIAEGQNILDAVLPTPSGHSDFLNDIQIDSAFDFNVADVYVNIIIIFSKNYKRICS